VTYPLLVLALTGSPAKTGIVGFAAAVPVTALALPAGALADRLDRKRLMIAADGIRALAMAVLALAIAGGRAAGLAVALASTAAPALRHPPALPPLDRPAR
jgi:MFS family permease